MKSILFILLISIVSCTSSNSQSQKKPDQLPNTKQAIGYINIFFDKYKNENAKKAVDYIFSTSKSEVVLDDLEKKFDSLRTGLGGFTGYEQITEKNVADGLVLFSYLVKHKNHPLRFTFIFYKPQVDWVIYKFNFDANLVDELEYSGKIYFIK